MSFLANKGPLIMALKTKFTAGFFLKKSIVRSMGFMTGKTATLLEN
jgi:hypothetical protein